MNRSDSPMVETAADPAGREPTPPQPSAFLNPRSAATRSFDPRRKSPALACVLSIMPGLGQVYVGYYKLGFIHLFVFGATIAFLASETLDELVPLLALFVPFFFLYNIVDAGRRAGFYNQALEGMQGVPELPADLTLPTGGSLFGGVVLVVVGLVFLSNTKFGISWDWLEEWWPLVPIVFGVYLFARGMQERGKKR